MKNVIFTCMVVILMASCASTTKFPVSQLVPAAEITAKVTKENQNTFLVAINANDLANAQRLTPPKSVYVVWVVTRENNIKNVGLLNVENSQHASLKTVTPFEPFEVFITAENEGAISYPSGPEVARVNVPRF
jgi:hypothetical protein